MKRDKPFNKQGEDMRNVKNSWDWVYDAWVSLGINQFINMCVNTFKSRSLVTSLLPSSLPHTHAHTHTCIFTHTLSLTHTHVHTHLYLRRGLWKGFHSRKSVLRPMWCHGLHKSPHDGPHSPDMTWRHRTWHEQVKNIRCCVKIVSAALKNRSQGEELVCFLAFNKG